MSYTLLTIRAGSDTEDDVMYPLLSDADQTCPIALGSSDGEPSIYRANDVLLYRIEEGKKRQSLLELGDRPITVVVTDSRIAIYCEKYDKGGGFIGFGVGAAVALAANVASRALAARRRKGKALVGHVRYRWLSHVGAASKAGLLSRDKVRILVREGNQSAHPGAHLELLLLFKRGIDPHEIAAEIARRAAQARLLETDLSDEHRSEFELLAEASKLANKPKEYATHAMPTYYRAIASTAFSASDKGESET